jgi:hypothetical protein
MNYYYKKAYALKNNIPNETLFAEDYDVTGKKKFFYSTKEIIYNYSIDEKRESNFYETIENNQAVKLFFDLDYKKNKSKKIFIFN